MTLITENNNCFKIVVKNSSNWLEVDYMFIYVTLIKDTKTLELNWMLNVHNNLIIYINNTFDVVI